MQSNKDHKKLGCRPLIIFNWFVQFILKWKEFNVTWYIDLISVSLELELISGFILITLELELISVKQEPKLISI